eukprot:6209355-Pyramimonas_sp.AAC.1
MRQLGQNIGIDQHMQEAVRQIEDSRLSSQSPAGIAGQAAGSAMVAQYAVGSAEQPKAEVEVVSSAAGCRVQLVPRPLFVPAQP